jgi:hypothetical protein
MCVILYSINCLYCWCSHLSLLALSSSLYPSSVYVYVRESFYSLWVQPKYLDGESWQSPYDNRKARVLGKTPNMLLNFNIF